MLRASTGLEIKIENQEQAVGARIILEAVEEPLRQMALNAGKPPDIIVDRVRKLNNNEGFNFMTNTFVDLLEEGVVDPVKVTRNALQNAVSVASTLITTSHAIVS